MQWDPLNPTINNGIKALYISVPVLTVFLFKLICYVLPQLKVSVIVIETHFNQIIQREDLPTIIFFILLTIAYKKELLSSYINPLHAVIHSYK